jgi:hypothetical protein
VFSVLRHRESRWIRERWRAVLRRRCRLFKRFVWSLAVVLVTEGVEVALLRDARVAHRIDRLAPESAVHVFMGAVFLRRRGANALMYNPGLHPVGIQEREAVNDGGRKVYAVVCANRPLQAILAKRFLEDEIGQPAFRGEQPVTG